MTGGKRRTLSGEMSTDTPHPMPDASTEEWRRMLTGEEPSIAEMRRRWSRIPSSPRCKMCAAPFAGLGKVATRLIMHGPSSSNPLMCNVCFGQLRQHPGGAEIDLSILFADVRGSTGHAERLGAQQFHQLIQAFYRLSARSIEHQDGVVDKFLGDGVMALFIPVLTGEDHAGRAIAAATDLLRATAASRDLSSARIGVGVGVHRGLAFTGVIGADDRLDFTALGDAVNVAARLGDVAGPGELVVSRAAWDGPNRDTTLPSTSIEVAGRTEPLDVVTIRPI